MSDENVTAPTTSDYCIILQPSYLDTKARLEFRGNCLKQDKITFNHGKIVKIYIFYEFDMIFVKTSPTLVFFEHLVWLKMLILKNTNILDTELDLIEIMFNRLAMDLVEM